MRMDLIQKPHSGMFPVRAGHVPPLLNVAATCTATRCLGPGWRAGLWVQGCRLHCPGCIAPEWLSDHANRLITPERLAKELLADPRTSGFTISGGEPFLQPGGLSAMLREARRMRDIDVICYTGFLLAELVDNPPSSEVFDLLDQLDVLIDGPYIQERNRGVGLRGSDNQGVHRLSGRLATFDFEGCPRQVELVLGDQELQLIGIPPVGFLPALDACLVELPTKTDGKNR